MLKKHETIMKRAMCPDKNDLAKVGFENGFYYAANGYLIVRSEDRPSTLPIFDDTENHPNYSKYFETACDVPYHDVTIPYTVQEIRDWIKDCRKRALRFPFKLGTRDSTYWVGINPKFLADAMETTKSNVVSVPEKGHMLLMQGNGFVWLIMPIALRGDEKDKNMTDIDEVRAIVEKVMVEAR